MKTRRFVSTQNRLNLVFTLLFLVGTVLLTSLIQTSIRAMSYNTAARATYTQARQLYQAKVHLQQFETMLNEYELTGDYDSLSAYHTSYARLQQSLAGLAAGTELPDEEAALIRLMHDVEALRGRFDRVIEAVDAGDWERVDRLDEEAYSLVPTVFDQIDRLIEARSVALSGLRDEVDAFIVRAWLASVLAMPVFLGVVAVVVVTVARQIHAPLTCMTDTLEQIRAERFDPAALAPLAERRDEVGYLAREYLQMASAVLQRRASLQQEADEIRAKIR